MLFVSLKYRQRTTRGPRLQRELHVVALTAGMITTIKNQLTRSGLLVPSLTILLPFISLYRLYKYCVFSESNCVATGSLVVYVNCKPLCRRLDLLVE